MWAFSSLGFLRNQDDLDSLAETDDLKSESGRVVPESSPEVLGRCRSHAKNRRVTPSTSGVMEKKVLQNGDVLRSGKRLLKDGCVYEGELRTGKGKITWPSGASYVGEFKAGKMEGFGTFLGADGDVYRGYWVGDRKEGFGQRKYANGDYYEGMWKKNVQDGEGRYVWANGDEYKGECTNGVANGRGTLVRANGDMYEGEWENGVLKGNRTVGTNDHNEGLRTENVRKKVFEDGSGVRRGLGEKSFPRICIWESDGEAGDITCDIINHSEEASMFYDDGMTTLDVGSITKSPTSGYCTPNKVKKPGQTVVKGHKNYELMLKLQLGIRYTVGKYASVSRELKPSDFEPKEKFWLRFPPEGSKITPPHHSVDFRWKDYCPVVFRHLRELFRVDPADYMLAICGSAALRELSSPGKSGSFFYLTQDDKYVIKTVKKSDVKVLVKMLPSYFQHMRKYENTLLTKFFGVHCVKPLGGHKVRFIVMGNLFCSDLPIHRRFDLKGSSHGRSIDKQEDEIDETTTFKDLDLHYVFRIQDNWFQELIKQIELDCGFLEAEKIMDYSLLVGVHFHDDKIGLSPLDLRSGESVSHQIKFQAEFQNTDKVVSGRKPLIRLGSNMPARAERMAVGDDTSSAQLGAEVHDVVLNFGIIDILQDYDITKKLEHAYKSIQADPTSISAVDPKLYSKRFREFIKRIFVEHQKLSSRWHQQVFQELDLVTDEKQKVKMNSRYNCAQKDR